MNIIYLRKHQHARDDKKVNIRVRLLGSNKHHVVLEIVYVLMLRRFQASLPDFQSMLTSYADVAKQCTEFKDFSVVEF